MGCRNTVRKGFFCWQAADSTSTPTSTSQRYKLRNSKLQFVLPLLCFHFACMGKARGGEHMFQQALSNTPRGVVMFQSRNRVRARTRQWHALGSRAELPGFGNTFQRLAGDIDGLLVFLFPCSTCILRVLPSRIPANVGSAWNTNRPTGPAAGIESPDLADVSCRWPQTRNPCHGLGCSHPLFFGTLFW